MFNFLRLRWPSNVYSRAGSYHPSFISGGYLERLNSENLSSSTQVEEIVAEMSTKTYDTLIFDIGDVLFTWSAETKTTISPKTLHKILGSTTWFEYEKGNISEVDCYNAVGREFGIGPDEIRKAFECARDSLQSRSFMVKLIRELKPGRKVYAMSNISAPDWEVLRKKGADWDIFDEVFTSAGAHERKPNLGYYRHVIERTGTDPSRAIFVDDKLDNVVAARSMGLTAIVYDSFENVERSLRNLCGDPVTRAQEFLSKGAGKFTSHTNIGQTIEENFAQLLILESTDNPSLVNYVKYDGAFNFFKGAGQLTTHDFPCDLDTTSIGLTIAPGIDPATKTRIMDEMLEYRTPDGLLQVYFDPKRPRQDPVVCVNVLTLFYTNGRGHELTETRDWVFSVLKNRAYLEGTRYYEGAETFLFFMSRLYEASDDVRRLMGATYKERVRERIGSGGDALALAMRVICANQVGLDASVDLERLLDMQQVDGGWNDGWFYKYGSADIKIANRGLTTALAVQAIQGAMTIGRGQIEIRERAKVQKRKSSSKFWMAGVAIAVGAAAMLTPNASLPILKA